MSEIQDLGARYGGRLAIITIYVNTDEDFHKLGARIRKAARGQKLNAARVQIEGYEAGPDAIKAWEAIAAAMAKEMAHPKAVPFDDGTGSTLLQRGDRPVTEQICKACGHEHCGVAFAFICVGCPCGERPGKPTIPPDVGETSDGYHTFNELYDHRHTLFLALCKLTTEVEDNQRVVWRSLLHSDGTSLEGWFIMGNGDEPGQQITYHLPIARWDEAGFADTLERAPTWDGHTSTDVLKRLRTLYRP